MKIALAAPDWGNSWKPSLQKAFEDGGHEVRWVSDLSDLRLVYKWSDRCLSMWADQFAIEISNNYKKPFYTYLRAYEAFTEMPSKINWANVKGLFFCNWNTSKITERIFGETISKSNPALLCHLVKNWIDVEKYPFKKRTNGTEIAMVCDLNFKKNIPLAIQIMAYLPDKYTLHIIGQCQDESLILYMSNLIVDLKLEKRIKMYDRRPHKDLPEFLEDKNYILSTSMREGCPMNILEAMSMGIKPIIHNWPGAKNLFPEHVFSKITEVKGIIASTYMSGNYRDFISKNHGLDNAKRLVDVVTSN